MNDTMERGAVTRRLLDAALALSIVTVLYNLVEGAVSVYFGLEDETLSLLGFGVDSFVEVISGLGIGHMVWRMKRQPVEGRDRFERLALRITGTSFYLLAVGLMAGSVAALVTGNRPTTTMAGVVISAVSILTMGILIRLKLKVGRRLGSDAIVADAHCTRACLRLSFTLLAASLLYELLRLPFVDVIGGLVIAYLSLREGMEAFEKASSR